MKGDVRRRVRAIADRAPDNHPDRVAAEAMRGLTVMPLTFASEDALIAVALLHDSLEDGYATVDELYEIGLSVDLVSAIVTLTRAPNETYADYIRRVYETGGIAWQVKRADLQINLARCEVDGNERKAKRYRKALALEQL